MTEPPTGGEPVRPPRPGWRGILLAGWFRAALRGAVCFLIVLAVGALLAFLQFLVSSAELPLSSVPSVAAVIALLFHRVPMEVGFHLTGSASGTEIVVTFSVGLLLGTALVGWLLFRAGRRTAERLGGEPRVRLIHAAKVAVVYGVTSFLASFLGKVPGGVGGLGVPGSPGPQASVRPVYAMAFVVPLLLAATFAGAGALWTIRDRLFSEERMRLLRGALAGGWRMAWLASVLGAAGFLVVAALHPDVTRAFLETAAREGPAGAALATVGAVMLLPNVGVGAAVAAMGGSIDFEFLGRSCTLFSYWEFPTSAGLAPATQAEDPCSALSLVTDTAPAGYLLFLLVPVAATLLGGWLSARRAGASTSPESAVAGAASAPVFGLALLGLMVLARVTYSVPAALAPLTGDRGVGVGPKLLSGILLALLWGAVGGAAGGWLGGRRSETPTSPS